MNRRDRLLLDTLKRTLRWLILLGDHIGNGTPADPNGRCDTILVVRRAIHEIDPTDPDAWVEPSN